MRGLPSGIVTFLFTDIEGSTRLLTELGAHGYADALAAHRRLLRDAFARHGGVEVGTEGDAFFVAFARAPEALDAAQEAQAALSEGSIRVRMGLHTGEPLLTEAGYVGIDVHRAARIAAAGHGGQVLLSRATREHLDSAPDLRDLGEHRLKDLEETEWLHQVGTEEFPPLRSLSNTNLPTPASSMVGRRRALTALCDLVRSGRDRIVTLTGPGGTGKTRLSIEAARELLPEFSNGVFFVELAPIRDWRLVVYEIAQVLGVHERGSHDLEQALIAHLEPKTVLIVLDNFEHVVGAAPIVARLVRACPRVGILVTSRAALRIDGERELPVAPLDLPDPGDGDPDDLARTESVALFVERARSVSPDFALTDRTAPAVAEICRRLDGLPLAIELAAARIKVLDPEALLARLGRRLPLLTAGPRDAPERQRTLRAAIEWSYDLLDQEERTLFARLAVFPATFSLEAAEAVAGADLETLSKLIDESLIKPMDDVRFLMLETIREYGHERLEDSEIAELRRRHAEHFLELAEKAEAELAGPEQITLLDLLEADHDNLRAALAWLGDHDPEHQTRLTVALRRFWYVRGYLSEGRRWLSQALGTPAIAPRLRRRAATAAAALALLQGDYEEATRLADESVEIARAVGKGTDVANSLSNLGAIVLAAGDHQRARLLLEEGVARAREAGDVRIAALAINNLGDVALTTGDYPRAEALFVESLAMLRERGDAANVARSLFNLGAVAFRLGRHEDAVERLRESATLCRRLGDKEDLAWCLEGFAAFAAAEGDAERAARLIGAAGKLLEDMGAALKPFERQLHDQTVAFVRANLDDAALADATEKGAKLTADEVIRYAVPSGAPNRSLGLIPPSDSQHSHK